MFRYAGVVKVKNKEKSRLISCQPRLGIYESPMIHVVSGLGVINCQQQLLLLPLQQPSSLPALS